VTGQVLGRKLLVVNIMEIAGKPVEVFGLIKELGVGSRSNCYHIGVKTLVGIGDVRVKKSSGFVFGWECHIGVV